MARPASPVTGWREKLARLCQRARVLPLAGQVRGLMHDDLRILAYHRVLDRARAADFMFDAELISASPETFREQMKLVRRRFHPMRFDEVLDRVESGRRLPRRAVVISFDDGYEDNHRVAFPILRDLGMSAMFFVSTGHIDSGLPYAYDWLVHMLYVSPEATLSVPELDIEWDLPEYPAQRRALAARLLDRIKTLPADAQDGVIARLEQSLQMQRADHPDCRPMSWHQLREMRDAGMEVGSHGVGHRMLGKLPADLMRREIRESKATLDRELGVSAQVISYPVGGHDAFNAAVIDEVKSAGFRMACSYMTGVDRVTPQTRYAMSRLPVEMMDASWFEAMMAVPEVFGYPRRRART